ncbi:hypothetical protein Tco_0153710 [Tanacetum coccineum]
MMNAASTSNPSFIWDVGEAYPSHVIAPNFVTVKLSSRNKYNMWKTQMICLLKSHQMYGFIDGQFPSPAGIGKGKVGLRASRKLKPELLRLVRGNGQREATGYVFVLNGGAVDSEECQSKAFSLLHFVELSILLPLMLLRKRNGFRKYSFLARDVPIIEKPINMYCDNTGAIAIANEVSCYTDAGYLTDADDLKSQTGYVFVLNGGVVDWKSAKQSIFATSSAEAECIAAFDASKEAVWVRKFIYGLGVVPTIEKPINMYCDNTRAIAIANESGITKGARHFCSKVHYHLSFTCAYRLNDLKFSCRPTHAFEHYEGNIELLCLRTK